MKYDLPSGKPFLVTPLPYEQAWEVTQTVLSEVEKIQLNLKGVNLDDLMATDILELKGPICSFLSSPKILNAAKLCFGKCSYDSIRVDKDTFESLEGRGDFLYCAFYALKENVAPFFGNLTSFLKG